MASDKTLKSGEAESQVDPADYIFKHPEYHDWCVTVEDLNSTTATSERIGVASCHLLSQSSFFRKMVENDKLKDNKNIIITNVSAEVFKLVLTFVYGGKLPDMDRSTAAQLALAADMYNITPLIKKADEYLVPTGVQDVFPALWVVASITSPTLEPLVVKIVQEETEDLIASKEFLEMDSKCLDFIAKQEKLAINELDLWKALVKWGQHKELSDPTKTLREHLQNTLQYVRLSTFSREEIIEEVTRTKTLTDMDFSTTVTRNQPWETMRFCKTQSAGEFSDERDHQLTSKQDETATETTSYNESTFSTRFNNGKTCSLTRSLASGTFMCRPDHSHSPESK